MKIQIAIRTESPTLESLKESNPEIFEPFESWSELSFEFSLQNLQGDCWLLIAKAEDDSFETLSPIFGSKENAIGAFLTLALEKGWEELPDRILFLHIWEENGTLFAATYFEGQTELFKHDNLEALSRKLASANRVVVFSIDVVAKIRDVFPNLEAKTYSISRNLSNTELENTSLEELLGAKVDGIDIPKHLEALTNDLVSRGLIKPVWLPIRDCLQEL
ncbi:MAG: hypothetical protein NZL90_04950 [Aquificaceae bacterium]|nr:hypothetical protein [Aquificaceae bacterium]MDW8237572.1 hypothetical protein [Aquificaceae bacterium]